PQQTSKGNSTKPSGRKSHWQHKTQRLGSNQMWNPRKSQSANPVSSHSSYHQAQHYPLYQSAQHKHQHEYKDIDRL
ncbi:Hypothetical predicted protein, partial [Olea europaea subsp. europaea]